MKLTPDAQALVAATLAAAVIRNNQTAGLSAINAVAEFDKIMVSLHNKYGTLTHKESLALAREAVKD